MNLRKRERVNPIPAESSIPEYPLLPLPAFEWQDR